MYLHVHARVCSSRGTTLGTEQHIDSGGEIDINEFLECFRLINAKRDHTIRVTRHSLMLAEHQKADAQNGQASEC